MIEYWVRPKGVAPDVLFALLCGDVSAPVTFGVNRIGWAPTVQLTAYLRGVPADGWLRVMCTTMQIGQDWFDEDHVVVDCEGRIIVQTRQLAMVPPARDAEASSARRLRCLPAWPESRSSAAEVSARHCCRACCAPGGRSRTWWSPRSDPDRAKYLSETYSVLVTSVPTRSTRAAYVIVAVKPSDVESVVGEIAEAAAKAENDSAEQVFVTVAAGVTTAVLRDQAACRVAGDPGDAQRADASSAAGSARWRRAGSRPPSSSRRCRRSSTRSAGC